MQSQIIFEENVANWVARALLQSGAYRLCKTTDRDHWFLWKSGIVAPVYCNTRQLISHPEGRLVAMAGLHAALDTFENVEGVLGMATAGIGWAHTLAHLAGLPAGYIRATLKDHGLTGLVEYYAGGSAKRVVIIDDLVASGGSIKKAIDVAEASSLDVVGVLSIVNWGFQKMRNDLRGVQVRCLVSYQPIIQILDLEDDAKEDLRNFYADPGAHVWQSSSFAQPIQEIAV